MSNAKPYQRTPGGNYYIRISDANGKRPPVSLNTKNLKEARRIVEGMKAKLRDAKHLGKEHVLFSKAMLLYFHSGTGDITDNTLRRYKSSVRNLEPFFERTFVADIDVPMILEFIDERRDAEVTDKTINNDLSPLSRMLSMCVMRGWIEHNPMASFDRKYLKAANRRDRILTAQEYKDLMAIATAHGLTGHERQAPHLASMIEAAYETGLRYSEQAGALRANMSVNIKTGREVLRVMSAKTKKYRSIPLTKAAVGAINRTTPHPKSDYIWAYGKDGNAIGSVKGSFAACLKKAGIEDFRWHDLRHCAATNWRKKGMSLDRIMELLGHSSLNMVLRYADLFDDELAEAMDEYERQLPA